MLHLSIFGAVSAAITVVLWAARIPNSLRSCSLLPLNAARPHRVLIPGPRYRSGKRRLLRLPQQRG
jgi:hypothetical protein